PAGLSMRRPDGQPLARCIAPPRLMPSRTGVTPVGEMSAEQHKAQAPRSVRVFVLTISDTRTEADDTSGQLARRLVEEAGHAVAGHRIVRDEPAEVRALLGRLAEDGAADVVVSSGGTGI